MGVSGMFIGASRCDKYPLAEAGQRNPHLGCQLSGLVIPSGVEGPCGRVLQAGLVTMLFTRTKQAVPGEYPWAVWSTCRVQVLRLRMAHASRGPYSAQDDALASSRHQAAAAAAFLGDRFA